MMKMMKAARLYIYFPYGQISNKRPYSSSQSTQNLLFYSCICIVKRQQRFAIIYPFIHTRATGDDFVLVFEKQTLATPQINITFNKDDVEQIDELTFAFWFKLSSTPTNGMLFTFLHSFYFSNFKNVRTTSYER